MKAKDAAVDYLLAAGLSVKTIDKLRGIGYFDAPANSRHHLAHEGGLCEHSINVVELMRQLHVFADDISNCRVGMLHDLVKCRSYQKATSAPNAGYEYVQPPYPGLGVASVMIANELGITLLPEETAAITWHMGAFGLNERELKEYHAAIRRFPHEIILTHAADHLASVIEEGGAK